MARNTAVVAATVGAGVALAALAAWTLKARNAQAGASAAPAGNPRAQLARRRSEDEDDEDLAAAGEGTELVPPVVGGDAPRDQQSPHVFKFVLTGGPCAGKTTALARLSTYLRYRGFRVFTVPEAATLLFCNGAAFSDLPTPERQARFQVQVLNTQMGLENAFYELALNCGHPSVLLCDRGTMDGSAYVSKDVWQIVLKTVGKDVIELRDGRYNAVIHMITAADGAEPYYSLKNNEARTETPEEARAVDRRTQQAWVGHPNLFVVDNSTGFEVKLQRVVDRIASHVGLPNAIKSFRRFLLKSIPVVSGVHFERFSVNKVYLKLTTHREMRGDLRSPHHEHAASDPGEYPYAFVRRRRQNGLSSFGYTHVDLGADGQKVELKRIISAREYKRCIVEQADPARRVVRQIRTCFLYKGRYFELYQYRQPSEGLCVLNCQAAPGEEVELPEWLQVDREVTDDQRYSSYDLSLRSEHHASSSRSSRPVTPVQFTPRVLPATQSQSENPSPAQ